MSLGFGFESIRKEITIAPYAVFLASHSLIDIDMQERAGFVNQWDAERQARDALVQHRV